jgi:alcohol dehydrogenase (cytochrome c)
MRGRPFRGERRARLAAVPFMVPVVLIAGLWLGTSTHTQNLEFVPVSDETLRKPDAADWIHWRRTSDGWGYSPLNGITRQNVANLRLVWSTSSLAGEGQEAPLVYRGVMYWPTTTGVRALNGATGEVLWEYRASEPKNVRRAPSQAWGVARRNIAIYGDKIIAATVDAHLIALDARTGTLIWDQAVANPKQGYRYSSGPIIVKGRVIAGMTGCDLFKEDVCFITAHDAQTGKEVWRTSTVAQPGQPGGDTWGDLPLAFRAGSDAWIPGSYDPATNLIYWSTAQAKPWASAQRGTDGAALYTNCTLALDPETGKIVWYYQHLPAETLDLDEVFEMVLVDNGGRQSLFKMGKIGVLWELDRRTGKFLNAYDTGYQNAVKIDRTTGQGVFPPERTPKLGVPLEYCPGPGGLKNLYAMAYHPDTRAFYIPLKLSCANAIYEALRDFSVGGGGPGPSRRKSVLHPASPTNLGEFVAMDSRSGKILWRRPNRLPYDTAALTTAGGLVFVGDITGRFYAMDAASGKVLWEITTPSAADGFPITYAVGGKQYLAVPSGPGWVITWQHIRDVFPNEPQPKPGGGSAVHVYALPEK